jgi:hypothetical protein
MTYETTHVKRNLSPIFNLITQAKNDKKKHHKVIFWKY